MDVPLAQLGRPALALAQGILRFEQDETAGTSELGREVDGCLDRQATIRQESPTHSVQGQGARRLPSQQVDDPSFEIHGRFARVRSAR